ncbi:zinc finger CCCH domain-containing protein 6-like isoform X2 [Wolffia australiana]
MEEGDTRDLDDSLRQLSLGGEVDDLPAYPERPGEPGCNYYMRTGRCDYGVKCRFNHPRDRVINAPASPGTEYPERAGLPVCQYFFKTGSCKFGISCKYHHPKRDETATQVQLNVDGYPVRNGQRECSYYVKNGSCKFGATCKFHHPQPDFISLQESGHLFYPPALSPYQLSTMAGYQGAGSYALGPYGTVFVPSVTGWNPYMPSLSPVVHPGNGVSDEEGLLHGLTHQISMPASGTSQPNRTSSAFSFPLNNGQREHSLPERPDQPECQHYVKTGHCKFGSVCKFHHPSEKVAPKASYFLNPVGLPLRPGAPYCIFFAQHGVCKFGPSCKFDHPMGTLTYSASANSPVDIPLGPFTFPTSSAITLPASSFFHDIALGSQPTTAFNSSSISLSTTQVPTQIPTSSSSSCNGVVGICTSAVETR